jgi:hypothetical protein
VLRHAIDDDRFPLSPRVMMLKGMLQKIRPEPAREPAAPPKQFEPPSKGRYGRRR